MAEQESLFGPPAPDPTARAQPLAARLRPSRFEDLVGHQATVSMLRELARSGQLPSLILWGPPGSGKTTLAQLLAEATGARFSRLSAVGAGVADLRRVVAEAAQARRAGVRTVLFIDELHRFNKAQQDAVLPHVEDGTVTLIGATTENPSFEVISPLLSRSRVFRLQPLDPADLALILGRGRQELARDVDPDAEAALIEGAGGDARVALNVLEVAAALQPDGSIAVQSVMRAFSDGHLVHDRLGDQHYQIASALIKSIRGSDPDAAVYWVARMLEAGDDPLFVARRLVILAAEDVGLADPQALAVAVAAQQAAHFVGMPEAVLPLSEAALYLALAPKSNSALTAYTAAAALIKRTGSLPVPMHLRNASTGLERGLGYGHGYQYAHDHVGGVADQVHLPDSVVGEAIYTPRALGAEGPLVESWRERAGSADQNQ